MRQKLYEFRPGQSEAVTVVSEIYRWGASYTLNAGT